MGDYEDGWLPGFERVHNPNVSTVGYATGGPARIMNHMTVGRAISASYIAGHRVPPQLWANSYDGRRYQTGSLRLPGKALYQPQFGSADSWTNRHGWTIQIEHVGVPEVNVKTYNTDQDRWIGEQVIASVIKWFRDMRIPYDENAFRIHDDSSGSANSGWHGRMSMEETIRTGGMVAHIDEWENDHWDCSVERLNVWLAIAKAKLGGTTPPPPTSNLIGRGMFLLQNDRRGIWLMGPGYAKGLNQEEYSQVKGIPGIGQHNCGNNERAFDLIYAACMASDSVAPSVIDNQNRQVGSWLLDDTKTKAGKDLPANLQIGRAADNLATSLRRNTRVRLIEAKGGYWATDLIHVRHMPTMETIYALLALGYFNNDSDDKGNIIAQKWSDDAFKALVLVGPDPDKPPVVTTGSDLGNVVEPDDSQ